MSSMSNTPRSPHREALYVSATSNYPLKPTDSPVKTPKFFGILDLLVEVAAAACDIGQDALVQLDILSAGMRSVVVRCVFDLELDSSGTRFSVIAKHYRRKDSAYNSGGFGYAREVCALPTFARFSPGLFTTLVGSDAVKRVIVTEDLGNIRSVHSQLVSGELEQGLKSYLTFFEAVYAQDHKWHLDFKNRVHELDAKATSPGALTSPRLAIKGWRRLATITGTALSEPLETALEINTVPGFLTHTVLTHGDFSPHNLAATSLGTRGFDAEGAAIHHTLLPVADMMLGFPLSPAHPSYLPLVETQLWQGTCRRLYELATQHDQAPNFDTDLHLTEQLLILTGMVVELDGFVAGTITPEHRKLLERTAERAFMHYPGASVLIHHVLEHKSL